jgi:predicted ATPase/DNA-binding winged helix-turn-helix (wHTH) protein
MLENDCPETTSVTQPSRERFAGDLAISVDRGCLLRGGREVRLRAKTFQVLVYLHNHSGRLVSKEDLFRAVWPDTFVSDDSLTKCVREIRDALGDRDHQLLKTVARRGFILDAPLRTVPHTGVRQPPAQGEPSESRTHNLPEPLTSFVGRKRQIAELAQLLHSTRLLTLTGAGGCGKTRLALEVARQVRDDFPDGVWLVDLAPLTESALVTQAVAAVLDVRQTSSRSLLDTLSDQLRHRRLLLVLDNCEHVIDASAELAETLLRAVPGLTILVTSREALGIGGETGWRVPSLTVPAADHAASSDDLMDYEGVHLLVERARAADSGFAITRGNAGAAIEVCRRLDGIPLAIELAAARLKVLSIEQINARLDDLFRLLAGQSRTIGRQRTLEATLEWSYELLSEAERRMLRRLSTFAGGWTLEAAEVICAGDGIARGDVLDLMARLVDKSLVMVDDEGNGHRRYRYLETVRQYAWERLRQSGEMDRLRARHFAFFLDLARRAEPELLKADQLQWLRDLDLEHDNLRTALEWQLSSDRPGPEGVEAAARLHWFWLKRAYFTEGRHWLETALARSATPPAARRAYALMALGTIVFFQGGFEHAQRLLEESAALARGAGELSVVALALGMHTLAALERGDVADAARRAEEAGAAARAAGDPWVEGPSLSYFAYQALFVGDVERAERLHEEILARGRAVGELWSIGIVLYDLAMLRVVQHRYADARALCREAIEIGREFRDRRAIAWCLGMFAGADAAEGHPLRAARLLGAMEGQLDSIGAPPQPSFNMVIRDRYFGAVEDELGSSAYQQALAEGRAMPLSQAITYAIDG